MANRHQHDLDHGLEGCGAPWDEEPGIGLLASGDIIRVGRVFAFPRFWTATSRSAPQARRRRSEGLWTSPPSRQPVGLIRRMSGEGIEAKRQMTTQQVLMQAGKSSPGLHGCGDRWMKSAPGDAEYRAGVGSASTLTIEEITRPPLYMCVFSGIKAPDPPIRGASARNRLRADKVRNPLAGQKWERRRASEEMCQAGRRVYRPAH